jgi:hypothetical protein
MRSLPFEPIRTRAGLPQDREAYYQDEADRLVAEGYTDYL